MSQKIHVKVGPITLTSNDRHYTCHYSTSTLLCNIGLAPEENLECKGDKELYSKEWDEIMDVFSLVILGALWRRTNVHSKFGSRHYETSPLLLLK